MLSGQLQEAYKMLKEANDFVQGQRSVPKAVFASIQLTFGVYYWKMEDYPLFIESLLSYEGYCNLTYLSTEEAEDLSEKMILASLLSDKHLVYGHIADSQLFSAVKGNSAKKVLFEIILIFH